MAFLYAWLLATLLSGIPSTAYALLTGGDAMEATRAAGAMVGRPDSVLAAAAVHLAVSTFWSVAALAFWPQFADHLAWGAFYSVGLSLGSPRATRP